MKYLLVLIVVLVGGWLLLRSRAPQVRDGKPRRPGPARKPAAMAECVHCGVHLPRGEAVTDAAGRPYCSDAHRLAGPR